MQPNTGDRNHIDKLSGHKMSSVLKTISAIVLLLASLALALDYWAMLGLPLEATRWIGIVYVSLLVLAPIVIYPLVWRKPSSLRLRIVLSLIPMLIWTLSEFFLRYSWHDFFEALWLTLSPFFLGHLVISFILMAIAHFACLVVSRQKLSILKGGAIVACLMVAFVVPASLFFPFAKAFNATFQAGLMPVPKNMPGRLDPNTVKSDVTQKPNIVFILSDDHRFDFSGYAGHPFIETPNIDTIAAQGVVFTRAYVGTSLCSPSRASFLTGVTSNKHGVWNNFTPWSDKNRTFFEYLKAVGYATAFIGKWHMPGNKLPEIAGLDHFVSFTNMGGQGQYEWNPLIVNGKEQASQTRYIATELTDRAMTWIEQNKAQPFVLYLSHKSVHAPFLPNEGDKQKYQAEDANVPEEAHLWSAQTDAQYVHLTTTPMDQSIKRYGEAIHSMDREIGRLLAQLKSLDLEENTIVIYTSDNGYQWGEHQLTDKRWAYEESFRIPFVMRWPGSGLVPGSKIDRIVGNIDVAATFLDLAGIEIPDYMDGLSLLKLIQDKDAPWRKYFHYSYYFEPPYPTPTTHAVVSQEFKLITTDWHGVELYDMKADPKEKNNLAGLADYQIIEKQMMAQLNARSVAE